MNSIAFGGDKGKRVEVYCLFGRYLCHGILFTRSHIIQLRWSLHYADFSSSFTDDKMILQTITVHDKYKGDFFTFLENDNPLYFYGSLKRVPNLLDDTSSEQAEDF